jgi:hypothetical protein
VPVDEDLDIKQHVEHSSSSNRLQGSSQAPSKGRRQMAFKGSSQSDTALSLSGDKSRKASASGRSRKGKKLDVSGT